MSDDEMSTYTLREMSKSSTTALSGILHFNTKICNEGRLLTKSNMELIASVVSIFGKDSPEVFFFGCNTMSSHIRLILRKSDELSERSEKDMTLAASIFQTEPMILSCIQQCINALSYYQLPRQDQSFVNSAFHLMYSVLLLNKPPLPINSQALTSLADLLNSQLLCQLSPDTCAIVLSTLSLFDDKIFLRKDICNFCCDYLQSDEERSPVLVLNCVMYLSTSLANKENDSIRATLISRLVRSPKIMTVVCTELADHSILNDRLFVFVLLRLVCQMLSTSLRLREEDAGEDEGLTGLFYSQENISSKLPALFSAVNMDVLDDIFAAYTEEVAGAAVNEGDSQIVVALFGIGYCSVKYYRNSSLILATVRRWALGGIMASDALIAASGLSTIAELHVQTNENIAALISAESFGQCLDTLRSRSVEWACEEGFRFISRIPNEEYMGVYFDKFCLNLNVLFYEKIKVCFFAKFSLKEILAKIITEFVYPKNALSYEQLVPLSRILAQMVLAAKSKGLLAQFQQETLRLELERNRLGTRKHGFLVSLVAAIQLVVSVHADLETGELLAFVASEVVSADLSKLLGSIFPNIFFSDPKYKPPFSPSAVIQPLPIREDTVAAFIEHGCIRKEERKKAPEAAPPTTKSSAKTQEDGWMDSAANWFLDYAPDEELVEEKHVVKVNEEEPQPAVIEESKAAVSKAPVAKVPATKAPLTKAAAAKAPVTKAAAEKAPLSKAAVTKAPLTKAAVAKAVVTKALSAKAPAAKAAVAPEAKKALAKAPVAKPAPVEAPEEPVVEVEKKKKKSHKEEEGIGAYIDTDALYTSLGGWFATEPPPKKDKKHKKKDEEEEEEKEVKPVKAVVKKAAPPAAKQTVAKAPIINK